MALSLDILQNLRCDVHRTYCFVVESTPMPRPFLHIPLARHILPSQIYSWRVERSPFYCLLPPSWARHRFAWIEYASLKPKWISPPPVLKNAKDCSFPTLSGDWRILATIFFLKSAIKLMIIIKSANDAVIELNQQCTQHAASAVKLGIHFLRGVSRASVKLTNITCP